MVNSGFMIRRTGNFFGKPSCLRLVLQLQVHMRLMENNMWWLHAAAQNLERKGEIVTWHFHYLNMNSRRKFIKSSGTMMLALQTGLSSDLFASLRHKVKVD